ncbi:TPA: ParB/RepB/Spo0J family partition protein [Burkholderia vietnamiensis]|nr:ParB/RepB/Spo0J family partition protein [Burkholderia vietnamiensis]
MSRNIREEMLAKTADMTPAAKRVVDDAPSDNKTTKPAVPTTAPGMGAALTAAQLRIRELEESGAWGKLKVAEISPNPWQPRRRFDQKKLEELATSIRAAGQMQPIVVRRAGSRYQLVAGERRWRAHQMLGLEEIKAVVMDVSDADMAALALAENMGRDDLSDYEIALAVQRAEREFPTKTELAEKVGVSRQELYRLLSFDALPDFVKKGLDLNPRLLSSVFAERVVATLKKHGDKGDAALANLWPQVVSGELAQFRLPELIALNAKDSPKASASRTIEKLFSGKTQAGSITSDEKGYVVKIKPGVMSDAQWSEFKDYIGKMFQIGADTDQS